MDGCHLEGRLLNPLQSNYIIDRAEDNLVGGCPGMANKIDLGGRHAAVTGAAQGIGAVFDISGGRATS
jgi:hypothetical protein